MKSIFLIITLLLYSLPTLANWELSTKLEPINQSSRHVLTWTKVKRQQLYRPQILPFGMSLFEKVQINNRTLFVTTWPYNGQSVVYRIFDPEIKNTPLCEVQSYSDKTNLRTNRKTIQIHIIKDPRAPDKESTKEWFFCTST